MAAQNSKNQHTGPDMAATGAVEITGSAQSLSVDGIGLLITTTGDIEFTLADGSTVDWASIPVGQHRGLAVRSIVSATATGYVLL